MRGALVFACLALALAACGSPSQPPPAAPTLIATPAPTVSASTPPGAQPTVAASTPAGVRPAPGARPTFAPAAPGVVAPPAPGSGAPGAQAQPTVDPTGSSDAEVQDAFLTNIDDVISEAYDLSVTPCDDLTRVLKDNPNLVPSIHGFAASLKRVGAQQAVLDTPDVKAALADLDQTIGQLDGALSVCGISQP